MIKTLTVKNYALIDEIEVDFERGLNIITGETGAGKSILIEAFNLLLGERAGSEVIRKGAEKSVVEGMFAVTENRKVLTFLKSNELDSAESLLVRRELSLKGPSRCFVNDTPVPLNVLKSLGDLLVDLHGQHEHQSLLRTDTHIDVLDDFGGLEGLVREFRASYHLLTDLSSELQELSAREKDLKLKRELYGFQVREIDALAPLPDEEERLERELKVLENAEKMFESTSELYSLLYEGEAAVYDLLVKARNQLEGLAEIDPVFREAWKECSSATAIVSELTKLIQSYNSKIEFNPERLEQIRERLGALALLKKKYGGSIEAVLQHRERVGREFEIAENFEEQVKRLHEKVEQSRSDSSQIAQRLSGKRRELVAKISKMVNEELERVGINHGQFDVVVTNSRVDGDDGSSRRTYVALGRENVAATPKGIDGVEFYIATNLGEDPKPLAKVASGGEVSRIMLALKTILAKSDRLPLLVFDEIDVGISGRIAQAVGRSLKNLAQFHQIITITHLPQIAGFADAHFVVEKVEAHRRTASRLRKLGEEERVREVAKLMSGDEVTAANLKGARELIRQE